MLSWDLFRTMFRSVRHAKKNTDRFWYTSEQLSSVSIRLNGLAFYMRHHLNIFTVFIKCSTESSTITSICISNVAWIRGHCTATIPFLSIVIRMKLNVLNIYAKFCADIVFENRYEWRHVNITRKSFNILRRIDNLYPPTKWTDMEISLHAKQKQK